MTIEEKRKLISTRDDNYTSLMEKLPVFLNSFNSLEKSGRFWEIILYKFVHKFVHDITPLVFGKGLEPLPKGAFEKILIPVDDNDYSNLRHQNSVFYEQFLYSVDLKKSIRAKHDTKISKKQLLKNWIFKLKLMVPSKKEKMLLFQEYYSEIWKYYYPEYRIIKVGLRLTERDNEVKINTNLREELREFLITEGFTAVLANGLSFSFPIDLLEGFMYHNLKVEKFTKGLKVDSMLAGWVPELWTAILCASNIERGVELRLVQHGGSYGESDYSFGDLIEQRLCDQFLSWSQKSYNEKIVPVIPTRLVAFRQNYHQTVKNISHDNLPKYRILIVDGMHYSTPTISDMVGWAGTKANVVNFIESYLDGEGTGILLRLYKGNYAKDEKFHKELLERFPKLIIHDEKHSLEIDLFCSEEVYVNYMFSTLKWEANFIGKAVKTLPGLAENAL